MALVKTGRNLLHAIKFRAERSSRCENRLMDYCMLNACSAKRVFLSPCPKIVFEGKVLQEKMSFPPKTVKELWEIMTD